MTIVSELSERVCRAERPRRILLGPDQYMRLSAHLSCLWSDGGALRFMGLPVVLEMPREFCRNCGAPTEPNVCSYCRTESTTISID